MLLSSGFHRELNFLNRIHIRIIKYLSRTVCALHLTSLETGQNLKQFLGELQNQYINSH